MQTNTANPKVNARARRKSLRIPGAIARDIGMQIVSGRFKPGDILHGEIETSGRLQVSRTAYREAVRILAAKGLVKAQRKVGTRVCPQDEWHLLDPDVLGWIFEFEPEDAMLVHLFELRRIMEPEIAALAAIRRSGADLQAMAAALAGMARHPLASDAGRRADQTFHAALLRAAGNVFVRSLTASVVAAVTWTAQSEGSQLYDYLPEHRRVYDAVVKQDAQAARAAMASLVELVLRHVTNVRKRRRGNKVVGTL